MASGFMQWQAFAIGGCCACCSRRCCALQCLFRKTTWPLLPAAPKQMPNVRQASEAAHDYGAGLPCGFAGDGFWAAGCQFATAYVGQNSDSTKSSGEAASSHGLHGVRLKFGRLVVTPGCEWSPAERFVSWSVPQKTVQQERL